MDLLLLYRTPKKKHYFNKVATEVLNTADAKVLGYNHLLFNFAFIFPLKKELTPALERSVDEVFKSREFFGSTFLKSIYKFLISCKIKCLHKGLHSLFKKNSIKTVLVWNGLKHPDLVLKEVLKDHPRIKTLYMENGLLPKTTFIDNIGINAGSSLKKEASFYLNTKLKNFPEYENLKGRSSIKKNDAHSEKNHLNNYLLLPFQMERDSQILDYSPWIKNMNQLFTEVKEALSSSETPDLPMVVREHPSTKVKYPNLYEKANESLKFDHQTPFSEALNRASVVVTVNSSVGFEAILMNKKVIVLGEAFYGIEGLCLQAKNQTELVHCFNQINQFNIDQDLKAHFLSFLYNDFLIHDDWKRPTKKHFESFKERFNSL
jgi:capsular polysaccharide export protein